MTEQNTETLNHLVTDAVGLFWSKDSTTLEGDTIPYTEVDAAADAIQRLGREEGMDTHNLLRIISRSTSLTPTQVFRKSAVVADIVSTPDWETYFSMIAQQILVGEMSLHDPKIIEEASRRIAQVIL